MRQFESLIDIGTPVEGDGKTIVYRYRGGIERGIGGRYIWKRGYSPTTTDNGILYPWQSKKECRADAKRFGMRAVFVESDR